jgi:hypothetical protein
MRRALHASALAGMSLFAGSGALAQSASTADGQQFLDQPVSAATHSGYVRKAYYAATRDGTRLAVTVYHPQGGGSVKLPALLWYIPEARAKAASVDDRQGLGGMGKAHRLLQMGRELTQECFCRFVIVALIAKLAVQDQREAASLRQIEAQADCTAEADPGEPPAKIEGNSRTPLSSSLLKA